MDPAEHSIPLEILERFRRGLASREESREIVAHLLRGCPVCAGHVAARSQEAGPGDYDSALDRFFGALANVRPTLELAVAPLAHPVAEVSASRSLARH
jgi:hypothetical protein